MARIAWFLCLLSTAALASVPGYVELQGRVSTAGGQPFTGVAPVKMAFYTSATAGTPSYVQSLGDLAIAGGLLSARVGPVDASVFASEVWVELEISGKPLPRTALASAPFAFHAAFADSAAQLDCVSCVSESELAFDPATQAELDASNAAAKAAYVDASGDTMTGSLTVEGTVRATQLATASARLEPTSTPPPCNPSSLGAMYFDAASSRLHVCTAGGWARLAVCSTACPVAASVTCGDPIRTGCGDACAGVGTGLSATDCLYNAQLAVCGAPVQDDCGNVCGLSGTDLDPSACADPTTVQCGVPITDACGNGCGALGTKCSAGAVCEGTSCSPIGSTPGTARASCLAIRDAVSGAASGTYWIDPDGSAAGTPFQVYCDMSTHGGGWTRCLAVNYLKSGKPAGWAKNTWLSAAWRTGSSSAFDDSPTGTSFGNICPALAASATQIYGAARYGAGSGWTAVTTPPVAFTQNLFAPGATALLTASGTVAIGVDSTFQGRFGIGCGSLYTSNTTQGIQSICINDGAHQQSMHTGWLCGQYPGSCGDACNQPCFCSPDTYCGGSNPQENNIVMSLYLR